MKKILLAAVLVFTSFEVTFAQDANQIPPEVDLNVVNISQDNKNALDVGAKVGDVLKYEVLVSSQDNNATGFETRADISQILQAAEVIDAGLGNLEGEELIFPTFTQVAPYEKEFSFFVRIQEGCGGLDALEGTFNGVTKRIDLACGLTDSGPGMEFALMIVLMLSGVVVWNFIGHRA